MPKHSKRSPWKHQKGWRSHGLACWDHEWESYREVVALVGAKSVNAWIRQWLNEAVKYERLQVEERDRDERGDGFE